MNKLYDAFHRNWPHIWDVTKRAFKTFWQAGVSAFLVGVATGQMTRTVVVAAIAAGLSAAWNILFLR